MKYCLTLSCLLLFFFSCNENKKVTSSQKEVTTKDSMELQNLQWLTGEWVNESDAKFSKETWKRLNDSTLTGFGYTQVENDTVFAEELRLSQEADEVFLTVVAYGQNDDAAVTFTMISSAENTVTFENKAHDFPQRIVYTQPVKDSIHAWVEGIIEGKMKKVDFYFSRNR